MAGRHRPGRVPAARRWAVHHQTAIGAAGFAVLAAAAAVVGALVGPSPDVDAGPQPITPAIGSAHASGAKPWPTVVPPTIGAPGAWDPDPNTATAPTAARPTPAHCSRCGDRTPPTATPSPTGQPPADADEPAPAANPQPAQPSVAVELLALVNRDRATAGCAPVALHPPLTAQSQAHAEAQAADDRMYHSGGVAGFDTWGENVAYGYDTAAAVHQAWMESPGHRANILNCAFTVMGAGAADGPSGRYWTEQFAA